MASSPPSQPRVCVTGAGGYIASWLVKLLLARGYAVNATVRDPCDPKNACLKQLDMAPENLQLFKADMLDYDMVATAFVGCEGVFHLASPVPIDKMVDKEIWYALAKMEAEEMALEYADKNGLHVVTFCSGAVFGPLLQADVLNITTKFLRYIIKGGPDTINNKFWPIVDVRDVADALLLLYNKAKPCQSYNYVDKLVEVDYKVGMNSDKLKNLGWKPRKLEETLADSIESYEKSGILNAEEEPCRVPYFYRMPPVLE
ncbi:hypothetical protein ZWY2020_010542 [Hordeum vulgare]|nr:hypothetical protein ZWY2020_010542 [Hordeum vulgare]